MKKRPGLLILLLGIGLMVHAQEPEKKMGVYVVNFANRDSSVKATIYYNKKNTPAESEYTYYWYYNNKIMFTQGGYEGRLLHGPYTCFYPDNNLKEKGWFKNGLKTGLWTSWYRNGKIRSVTEWKKSLKNGEEKQFDSSGLILQSFTYKKGQLSRAKIYEAGGIRKQKYKDGIEVKKESKAEKVKKENPKKETKETASGEKKQKSQSKISEKLKKLFHCNCKKKGNPATPAKPEPKGSNKKDTKK